MSVLHRYYLKEFIKFFLIIQIIIMFLIISVDYLAKLDHFLDSKATVFQTFEYVLLRAPIMLVGLVPSIIILSVIVVFGLMNRNNELIAIKSGGISVYYLVRPVFVSGIVLVLLIFFLGETIVPLTKAKSNVIEQEVIEGKKEIHRARKDIWLKQDNVIVHINYYNPQDKTIAGIILTELDKTFNITKRIDATKGSYQNGKWLFSKVVEQTYNIKEKDYTVKSYENKEYVIDLMPEDLKKIVKKSNEMNMAELSEYINKVEKEGYDATTYRVDLYGKTAFPFVCLIMAMIGAALGMRPIVRENMPMGVAAGIGISFFYWIMHGFCMSLGYGKVLPAFMSAWIANIFFFCFAVLFLITVDD
ncbi:MAG: LPS export ABC transporter permease LptG [Desulfobacteraceae bacterium]|nr:LPS export ABC transporter permease LptG [Desulfobacteraceae bacterium]